MKKAFALCLALALILSLASTTLASAEVVKPDKITIMVNGTVFTKENNRDAFEARWEELTGVDLVIIQTDHDAYFDVLGQTIASGDWPDVIILSSTYYSSYASEGVLWDMTDAWENSETKNSGRFLGDSVYEGLKLDDRLYGITPTRGNGCLTYIKKAWLDNVGLEAPTTYDEYIAVLKAFTEGDPDGNGIDGDTYGVSAAGLIGPEAPWVNYLPEFYQDAYPDFYQKEDGTWADGFTEEAMKGAFERLYAAYSAGYIDKESLTNGTKDCRNKFYEDKFGVFTYWAGTWAYNLTSNLEANGLDGELIALPPIAEVGTYFDRVPGTWSITTACKNPEGVFKYFFDTMLDGGDMQFLWTYGVEDIHWSRKAETLDLGKGDANPTYAEGEFHMLESLEIPDTQYTKHHIDPAISMATFAEGYEDPQEQALAAESKISSEVFNANSRLAFLPVSTDEMSMYNGDLITLKRELVALVVTQGMSYEDAMARFKADGGADWSQKIVDSLNAL